MHATIRTFFWFCFWDACSSARRPLCLAHMLTLRKTKLQPDGQNPVPYVGIVEHKLMAFQRYWVVPELRSHVRKKSSGQNVLPKSAAPIISCNTSSIHEQLCPRKMRAALKMGRGLLLGCYGCEQTAKGKTVLGDFADHSFCPRAVAGFVEMCLYTVIGVACATAGWCPVDASASYGVLVRPARGIGVAFFYWFGLRYVAMTSVMPFRARLLTVC